MFGVTTFRAAVQRHILNHTKNRHFNAPEHLDPSASIKQCNVLRGSDDNCTIDGNLLAQSQLNIARPWRQVDHQIIEVAPVRLPEHLSERTTDHRSTPDRRRPFGQQKRHGHYRNTVGNDRIERLSIWSFWPLALNTQHQCLRWSIDIRIQQTNTRTLRLKR